MEARIRAVLAALVLVSIAGFFGSTAVGEAPEWQQDLDYLTWDRRAEDSGAAAGRPVYLQPDGDRPGALSSVEAAPAWQLRIRDIYSLVTPRGWRAMVSRPKTAATATAKAALTVPAPGLAVQQPVGPVAQRQDAARGTFVR
jgi:hypothetical protein